MKLLLLLGVSAFAQYTPSGSPHAVTASGGGVNIISSACNGSSDTFAASVTLDTTGADTIVFDLTFYGGTASLGDFVFADSEGNLYTPDFFYDGGGAVVATISLMHADFPSTNASHTISASTLVSGHPSFVSICVAALSGTASSSFDQSSGAFNNSASSLINSSITPSVSNTYAISLVATTNPGVAVTINGGYTILNQVTPVDSVHFGLAMAGIQVASPSAQTPTWTFSSGSGTLTTTMADYKP